MPRENISSNKIERLAFYNLVTKFLLVSLKFSIVVLVVRFFGAEGRGLFVSINQVAGVVVNLFSLSTGDSLIHRISSRTIHRGDIFYSSLILVFFISFFSILIFSGVESIFDNFLGLGEYADYIVYLIPAFLMEYIASSSIRGCNKHREINVLSILGRLNILIFISMSVFFGKDTLHSFIEFYVYSLWVNVVVYYFYLKKINGPSQNNFSFRKNIYETLKYSLTIHPMVLLMEVENRFDIFILLYFVSLEAIGIYSIGVTMVQLSFYVSNSINTILFPYFSGSAHDLNLDKVIRSIRYSFVIVSLLVFFLLITGSFLIDLFFGGEFKDAFLVMVILLPGVIFDSISRIIVTWAKSFGHGLKMAPISIMTLSVNIILGILLVYLYGIIGAAVASLISYTLRSFPFIRVFKKTNNYADSLIPKKEDYWYVYQKTRELLYLLIFRR